jgi:hypothetical protein
MNSKKQKALDYARNLYVQVNENGLKKYTLQEISKKLHRDIKFEADYSTISKWAKRYLWEDTFIKLKQAGIEKAKGDIDNKIIDEKANTIADIYKSNKQLEKIAQNTILARITGQKLKDKDGNPINTDVSDTDIIRLIQHSETILLNLHDKTQDKNLEENNILPSININISDKLLEKLNKK